MSKKLRKKNGFFFRGELKKIENKITQNVRFRKGKEQLEIVIEHIFV